MNNLYDYTMSKLLPTSEFKWIDPEGFDFNKYTSNTAKGCVIEVYLKYSEELRRLSFSYSENRNQKKNGVCVSTKDC